MKILSELFVKRAVVGNAVEDAVAHGNNFPLVQYYALNAVGGMLSEEVAARPLLIWMPARNGDNHKQ